MSTLKVGTIQDHANSTTAMTIDSSGRILTPARPAFRVEKRASPQDVTSGTNTKVNFEHNLFDIGSNIGTSDKFTAPIAGVYHFEAMVRTQVTGGDDDDSVISTQGIYLYKNASLITYLNQQRLYRNSLGSVKVHFGQSNVAGSATLLLAASDEIEVYANITAGTGVQIGNSADGSVTFFSGFLIG